MTRATGPVVEPGRRPDASMSLLNDLFARPLDPGYEEAAARRAQTDPTGAASGSRFSPALVIGMVAVGLLLTLAALNVQKNAGVVSAERQGLIDRIRVEDERVDDLTQQVSSIEADIAELEESLLQNSATGQLVGDELRRLQVISGGVAVTGPAVVVTLNDAAEHDRVDDPQLARVLDVDLQQVVNGLWAAGAEAVSINGQRITALTAIRLADNVVKINYRPMAPPFDIVAVGDSSSLSSRFANGSGAQWLSHVATNSGLRFTIRSEDSMTVPAGNTPLIYAEPLEVR